MVQYRRARTDAVISAISDSTRRAILDRLAHKPERISDIAGHFPMSLTGFCKHVKVLERAGLVRRTRHGRENTLALTPQPLRDVAQWVFNYEKYWNARMDRLESFFTINKEKS
jgi:DNA-binding transcriptional ArsR family regulator